MCVCVCACALDEEGSLAFASKALVVVWTAMPYIYLTGYSDYLTGFCEPLLSPFRCHTAVKNV